MESDRGARFGATVLLSGAALAAAGLSPLRDPAGIRATCVGAAAAALLLVGWSNALARWLTLGGIALLLLGGRILPNPLIVAIALNVVWLLHRRSNPDRGASNAADNSTPSVAPFAILLVGSIRRSLDPGSFDRLPGALTDLLTLRGWVSSSVSPAIYGAALLPAAVMAIASLRCSWLWKSAATLLLVAAMVYGRVNESPWPAIAGLLFVPALLDRYAASSSSRAPRKQIALAVVSALVLAAVSLSASTSLCARATRSPWRVGFVNAMHATFEREPLPGSGPKDHSAPPRFGSFRQLIELAGAEVVDLVSPNDVATKKCDAFVTINYHGAEADAFVEPIRQAVQQGSRLLVLSDHTDLFGQQAPTNAVLKDTGIEIDFDSVVPNGLGERWVGSLEAARDPLFGPHHDGSGVSWSVGCSLTVAPPARTLARATHAFADRGVRSKPGGLDNLMRDADEPFGGMSIAATAPLGAGRVLVFGDTSAEQDCVVEEGHAFAQRVVAWLAGAESRSNLGASQSMADVASVGCCVASPFIAAAAEWLPFGSLVIALVDWRVDRIAASAGALEERREPTLWISHTDLPDLSTGRDHALSAEPLLQEAQRRGLVARLRDRDDEPKPGDLLTLLNPARELTSDDRADLRAFMEDGGGVLLFLGPRGEHAAHSLLKELDLELGQPLGGGLESRWDGPLSESKEVPKFDSCREIVGAGLERCTTLARVFERPVAVLGRLGLGGFLLVADEHLPLARVSDPDSGGSAPAARTLHEFIGALLNDIDPKSRSR